MSLLLTQNITERSFSILWEEPTYFLTTDKAIEGLGKTYNRDHATSAPMYRLNCEKLVAMPLFAGLAACSAVEGTARAVVSLVRIPIDGCRRDVNGYEMMQKRIQESGCYLVCGLGSATDSMRAVWQIFRGERELK